MGSSGRVNFRIIKACLAAGWLAALVGCSGSSPVRTTNFPVPNSISLQPTPSVSMELGTNQAFTAVPLDVSNNAISEPFTYQSSNTAVVTIASNGLACAGSWDSLTNPQICTPGSVGVAQITATAQGVTSPASTVYVHQKIDKVTVNGFTPPNVPPPNNICQSVGLVAYYEARAYNRGNDITPTVGQFTFQAINGTVADLSNTAPLLANVVDGVSLNQVQATAKIPGVTPIVARIGTAASLPANFNTCRVESISLEVTGSTSNSKTITPTVKDQLGTEITGVPLTWSSSHSGSVSVSSSGVATLNTGGGAATVIASCTPPTCNVGFASSLPIYPENVETLVPSNGTPPDRTVFVTSTGCGSIDNCFSVVVPVTVPGNTYGTITTLPATPDSLIFEPKGTKAFLGTDSSLLGSRGLAVVESTAGAVSHFPSAPGKVLAISPDGNTAIISDTVDSPNQVFIFETARNTVTPWRITGATAADFSPDSLKTYIVAGSTLYVYSKLDALKSIALTAPANDVTFLAQGGFAYVGGGDASGVSVFRTCDNGLADTVSTAAVPTFIKTLPGQAALLPLDPTDAFHVIGLAPPAIEIISVHPPSNTNWTGCTPAVVDDNPLPMSFDLGHGAFTAKQFIVSQDGATAYILTPNSTSVLVFNITAQTSSAIALAGNAAPLSMSLSSDGSRLFVGATDGSLHVLDTATGGDITQVPFPQGLCQDSAGQPFAGLTCNPDLVAVKP